MSWAEIARATGGWNIRLYDASRASAMLTLARAVTMHRWDPPWPMMSNSSIVGRILAFPECVSSWESRMRDMSLSGGYAVSATEILIAT